MKRTATMKIKRKHITGFLWLCLITLIKGEITLTVEDDGSEK